MNKTRINNMIKLLESYSNKKVILKEDEDEFDLNSFLKPNPNQLERYKEELERRKKTLEPFVKKIKLNLEEINETYENKQWESREEELFLELFYKSEVELNLEKYPNYIFIVKNDEVIAYLDFKEKEVIMNYGSTWRAFREKFEWHYEEILTFMEIMISKYLKLDSYTIFISGYGLT